MSANPSPLPRIRFRVVGQDDYMLSIDLNEDGAFVIDYGDYTSHKPKRGTVDDKHAEAIREAVEQLGEPRAHAAPEGAAGFVAELTLGGGPSVRQYKFWEGALEADPDLKRLVRALEVLA